jgi:hypothetical protein
MLSILIADTNVLDILILQVYRGLTTWKSGEHVRKPAETAELEREYKKRMQSLQRLAKLENGPQLALYQANLYQIAW